MGTTGASVRESSAYAPRTIATPKQSDRQWHFPTGVAAVQFRHHGFDDAVSSASGGISTSSRMVSPVTSARSLGFIEVASNSGSSNIDRWPRAVSPMQQRPLSPLPVASPVLPAPDKLIAAPLNSGHFSFDDAALKRYSNVIVH